jgi:hypothetical protein
LIAWLTTWFDVLRRYTKINDDFETIYQNEFFNTVRIDEEDADVTPFEDEKMFVIDFYLHEAKVILLKARDGSTEQKSSAIGHIIDDCEQLQEKLPLLTKNQVMNRIASIWEKSKVAGLKIFKELAIEFRKQVFQAIAKGGLGEAGDIFTYLN